MFMLSLFREFKKIPEAVEMDIKYELFNVFKTATLQEHATFSPASVPSQMHYFGVSQSHSHPSEPRSHYHTMNPPPNKLQSNIQKQNLGNRLVYSFPS
jgi:hypothetical protein